jgi:hypothetical protein
VTALTGRWARWWAISRQRGPDVARSLSRPHHVVVVSGGTGSAIRTPASEAMRLRSRCPKKRDSTNMIHAKGSANTNVTSNPIVAQRKATVNPNAMPATGTDVTL